MIIWVDDLRPGPAGTFWCRSTNEAIAAITMCYLTEEEIEYIDLDHDAGDYAWDGGDYIKILDWLDAAQLEDFPINIRIHSMNPVGRKNMQAIAQKNNWRVIL